MRFSHEQHIKHDPTESIAIDKEDATISAIAEIVSDIEPCVQGGSRDGRTKSPRTAQMHSTDRPDWSSASGLPARANRLQTFCTLDGSFPHYIGHWSGMDVAFLIAVDAIIDWAISGQKSLSLATGSPMHINLFERQSRNAHGHLDHPVDAIASKRIVQFAEKRPRQNGRKRLLEFKHLRCGTC